MIFYFFGCGGQSINLENDLTPYFDKAMEYYNRGKFVRAKDEFDYIILVDPGSRIANEAQYYKGESLFQLKEYDEARNSLDRFIRFSDDIKRIEIARYRLCECAINLSNIYQRDQKDTQKALEHLQMFIDDFPKSQFKNQAEISIKELRQKLARKDYESGRLYLKLEEYDSALIYFRLVLSTYYDTDYADEARIGIIFTHILKNNWGKAMNYFKAEEERFYNIDNYIKAKSLLENTETGLKLAHYYQLYK